MVVGVLRFLTNENDMEKYVISGPLKAFGIVLIFSVLARLANNWKSFENGMAWHPFASHCVMGWWQALN